MASTWSAGMVRRRSSSSSEIPSPKRSRAPSRLIGSSVPRPRADELGKLEPISLDGARERFVEGISDEELLLRLTMSAEQVDAMVAETAGATQ